MKWFKHETSAHKGSVLQELYAAFGVNEGYALYFRFIEYVAHKWDGISDPRFRILTSELRQYLKLTTRRLHQYAAIMELSDNSSFKVSEKFCDIYLPKLLEIRHRDALSSGQRSEKIPPISSGEENRRDKNRKEHTSANVSDSQRFENSIKFDFQTLFTRFPRPQKKTPSIVLMTEKITDQETYDRVGLAIDNYAQFCRDNGTEMGFILTFPSWWDEWTDWLTPPVSAHAKPDLSHIPWEKPEGA